MTTAELMEHLSKFVEFTVYSPYMHKMEQMDRQIRETFISGGVWKADGTAYFIVEHLVVEHEFSCQAETLDKLIQKVYHKVMVLDPNRNEG